MKNILEELQFQAELRYEELNEWVRKTDWTALLTSIMAATVQILMSDWGPRMHRTARVLARVAVAVYIAGYAFGRAIHWLNDWLSSLLSVHWPRLLETVTNIINSWKQLPQPTESKPRICSVPKAL